MVQCTRKNIPCGFPVETGRKLNVHKTFRRRPGRLLNVFCTFNLRPVSTGLVTSLIFYFSLLVWPNSKQAHIYSLYLTFLLNDSVNFFWRQSICQGVSVLSSNSNVEDNEDCTREDYFLSLLCEVAVKSYFFNDQPSFSFWINLHYKY